MTKTSNTAVKLTPEQFVFWLKGHFDANPDYFSKGMTGAETAFLAEKLDNVFTHVANPVPARPPQDRFGRQPAPPGFEALC